MQGNSPLGRFFRLAVVVLGIANLATGVCLGLRFKHYVKERVHFPFSFDLSDVKWMADASAVCVIVGISLLLIPLVRGAARSIRRWMVS